MARITKLLVANRGEIARRIMRTAREMGIATVAVYANPDAGAPFVREADEAVALGGTSSTETYLDAKKVIEAAKRAGADAIHPGYGFLAENAAFARAVVTAGLTWVGPSAKAIAAMGDKLEAKRLMVKAGVPTLPSVELAGDGAGDLAKRAAEVGYPLLVKAVAGGGGKGMRIVAHESDLAEAVGGARREAAAAFGDDTVFLERYLERSCHVEVQVLGDHYGNVVHCFERECSIQRRHQKIIEEAPSPAVDDELRARMGIAALEAARAIGYDNAGTVEFMLAPGGEFYFLEVNTRLQVEHPVTEAITGLDLVREQIHIAEGRPLAFTQGDLAIRGHAIEARLYAEDPAAGFLPAIGRIVAWAPPAHPPARFDSGVETGSEVSVHFDPMLAKVIVHADTRDEAALRLATVLERLQVHGVTTNRDFIVHVLRHPAFLEGDTTTDFIDRHDPEREHVPLPDDVHIAALAAALVAQDARRRAARVLTTIPSGWRNNPAVPQQARYTHRGDELAVRYQPCRDGSFTWSIDGQEGAARLWGVDGSNADIEVDGVRRVLQVTSSGDRTWVQTTRGEVQLVAIPRFPRREAEAVAGGYAAPMPGKIVRVDAAPGQRVAKGDILLILEAMKMEHRITATSNGIVAEVRVHEGQQVDAGAVLLVVEAEE